MAELVYDIDLNVRKALKGIDDLQNKLKKTNKTVEASGKVFSKFKGILAGVSIVGFGAIVKNSLGAADAIGKVANKTGFATDALQELRFAAEQSGMATNSLDTSLQRFSRRVGEAANGSGVLAKDLEKIGISIKNQDGSMRNINDVFMDYMKAIEGASSEQEKLRLAVAAFDMEGANMVNMLADGVDGLKDMRQESHDLGLVLDANTIKKATQAEDAWGRVAKQFKAIAIIASKGLAPVIKQIADDIAEMLKDKEKVQQIADTFKSFGDNLRYVWEHMDVVINMVKGFGIAWASIGILGMVGGWKTFAAAVRTSFTALGMVGSQSQTLVHILRGLLAATAALTAKFLAIAAAIWGAYEAIKWFVGLDDEIRSHADSVDRLSSSYRNLYGNMTHFKAGTSAEEARKAFEEHEKWLIKMGIKQAPTDKPSTPSTTPKMPELPKVDTTPMDAHISQWQDYNEEVRQTTGNFLPLKTATAEYNRNVEKLNYALKKGMITNKEHAKAMSNLNHEYAEFAGIIPMVNDELEEISTNDGKSWADGWSKAFKEYKDAAFDAATHARDIFRTTTDSMADMFYNFAKTGKLSFKDFANSVIDQILRIQSKQLAIQIMGVPSVGGGSSGGGLSNIFSSLVGNLFGGLFAGGGVIPSGRYGVVGEAGPELVQGPATVSRGTSSNVTYNINAVDAMSFKNLISSDPSLIFALTEQGRKSLPGYG